MPEKPLTFVLNDETTVNSYGFRTKNKGLKLERFKENPVMLAQHENNVWAVVGKWVNIRIKGSQLLADAEFDEEDEFAKKLMGKVERGYVKGCSIGFQPARDAFKLQPDGNFDMEDGELSEASICAIPSNAKSVRLYAASGEVIPEGEIKLSLQKLTNNPNLNHNPSQSKMELKLTPAALVALSLQSAEDVVAVSQAIEKVAADNVKLKADYALLQTQVEKQAQLQADALIDPLIAATTLTAEEGASFKELAKTNYELAAKMVNLRVPKTTLGDTLANPNGAVADLPKTIDEFAKMPHAKQLAFKTNNPEEYKALFAK